MSEGLIKEFEEIGALKTGHFQLTSGLHSAQYMQCATIFERPSVASKIVEKLLPKIPKDIDTVVAPAIGGVNMGYELARALDCRFIFTERENGVMTLRRGFTLTREERVLVVEDVVTTGGSVKEVLDIVRQHGSEVLGVAALVDRSKGQADFGVPFISLLTLDIATYQPENCPLCKEQIPIGRPGSRK